MLKLVAAFLLLSDIAQAVTETLTSPGADLTHGKAASLASIVTFVLSNL